MIDSATRMSNPSSPNRPRRPASTQHDFEEPHSILRNESAHGISSVMEASFNRENSCVPHFGAEKFVNSRRRPDLLKQPLFEEQEKGKEASDESSE